MDHQRFQDAGRTIYDFGGEFLVRCPRCGSRATVAPSGAVAHSATNAPPHLFGARRCVCPACGYIRESAGKRLSIGGPVDWYVGLPLWLQTPCCGHILWATNAAHRDYLEAYIQATLRERLPMPNKNRSLVGRLPRWMKQGKNREEVLKGLARLKRMLEETD